PRRVILDLVDAMAEAIERAQLRRVLVGLHAPGDRLATGERAERMQLLLRPARAFAAHGVAERAIAAEHIVVDERRGLIKDAVGARNASPLARAREKKSARGSLRGRLTHSAKRRYLMLLMNALPLGTPRPVTESQPAAVLIVC